MKPTCRNYHLIMEDVKEDLALATAKAADTRNGVCAGRKLLEGWQLKKIEQRRNNRRAR